MLNRTNRTYLLLSLLMMTGWACRTEPKPDDLLQALKPGEARIVITIDGAEFYKPESIFKGTVEATDKRLKLNLFDQFESNVIVAFSGDSWFKAKPVKKPIFTDNQMAASVLIGRLTDPVQRSGEGYLMTEGDITVDAFSDEKIIVRFSGRAGKYEFQKVPEKWNTVRGMIVYKRPPVTLDNVTGKEAYF